MVIIVIGLPGSGKTYFATHLAEEINAGYLSSDRIRKEMFENSAYSEEEKFVVYMEMLYRAKKQLEKCDRLVLDGTFYKDIIRQKFVDEMNGEKEIVFIEIVAEEPVIKTRLVQRRIDSDAGYEVYKKIRSVWEPLREAHLTVQSTNDNINTMLREATIYMRLKDDKRTDH